jgi:hypothetical protein
MSKPKTLTVEESTQLIVIRVLEVLPQAEPGAQGEIVKEVTKELERLPLIKPSESKRHKKIA